MRRKSLVVFVCLTLLLANGFLVPFIPSAAEEPGATVAPLVLTAAASGDGALITISFDRAMADPCGKQGQFSVSVGGADDPVTAAVLNSDRTKIDLILQTAITSSQAVALSYTEGDLASEEGGLLASIINMAVTVPAGKQDQETTEPEDREPPEEPATIMEMKVSAPLLMSAGEATHNPTAWNDSLLGGGMPGVASGDTIVLPDVAAANTTISIPVGVTSLTLQGSASYTGLSIQMDAGHPGLSLSIKDLVLTAPDNKAGIDFGNAAGANTLTLTGSSAIHGGANYAGVQVPSGRSLTIAGGGSLTATGGAGAQDIGSGAVGGVGTLVFNGTGVIKAANLTVPAGASGPYILRILNTTGTSAGVQTVTVKTGAGVDCVSGVTGTNGIFGSLYLKNNTDYQAAVAGFKIHKAGEVSFQQTAAFTSGTAAVTLDFVIANTPTVNDPPFVNTIAASSTQPTTAAVTGLDKGYEITARGVVYSSEANPTLENGTAVQAGLGIYGTGFYAVQITGLTPSSTYHVRAYATNEKGTSYGEDLTVTTDSGACSWTDISANLPASAQGDTSLGDMQFISDNEGWIANALSPEYYYTLNGGRSFKVIKGSLPLNIQAVYSIYFMNRDEGFIGGKNGHVYQTFNGGNSWYDLGSIGTGVTDIDFSSPTGRIGFCCGDRGKVYKITRSQYVNTVATMTSTNTYSSNNAYKVSTPVENEAWAVVGMEILHYDGTAWSTQDGPSDGYNAIDMVDDKIGWAAGYNNSGPIVLKTETGGELVGDRCWEYQWIAGSFNRALLDIFALDAQNVWAVGMGGLVLHTNDGGATWNPEAQGMTTNMMRAVSFTSTTNGYALGNNGTLLKYSPLPTAQTTGWTKMTAPAGVLTFDRVFADGNRVWTTGDTKIFYSADYPTQDLAPQYENANLNFNDACFRKSGSSVLGWAVGSGPDGVRTADASAGNWTDMTLIGSGTARAVHFPTDTVGYAVDNKNTFMKTTDGGQSKWQLVTPADNDPIDGHTHKITFTGVSSLFFVDENTGYAVTSDPEIRKTTDGGVHWDSEADGSYNDIFFTDANHGWAVGQGILRYHDGTWEQQVYPYKNYYNLESVFFINQNEGWVSGQGGIVMHTTDGGVTWTLMDTEVNKWSAGDDAWLLDIYFVSPNLGYAVGTGGTIIRFTGGGAPPVNTMPTVTTGSITGISDTGFTVAGNVTAEGGSAVTARGVVYATNANPTTADGKVVAAAAGTGYFTVDLTGLTAGTVYHVRAYATNGQGTSYGEDKTMTTLTVGGPSVITGDITNITTKGARVAGYATPGDLAGIIERGVVYSENADPTLNDSKVPYTADAVAGPILVNLTYLAPNKTYHVRAFATDGGVTNYGEDKTFTTPAGTAYGWTDISANLPATAQGNTALSDMHFISENEGWIVQGVNANIYHTTDGGRNFTTIAPPADTNGSSDRGINAIRMVDSLHGYIAAQNGKVYYTADGGATWKGVCSGGRPFYALTLQPGTDTAYACGYWALVKKVTPNGPESMPLQDTSWSTSLHAISFTFSGQGWVCGTEIVAHWINGQWTMDGSYPSSGTEGGSHNGIFMVNDNEGWCVLDYGYIIHTINGRDWDTQASPETFAPGTKRTLMGTFFLNTLEGWAVGDKGVMLHTVDGGASWNIEADGMTANMMRAVQFTSSDNGYALGNNGTLLKYGPLGAQQITAPTVTTGVITGVTTSGVTVGGNVTSSGGGTVTERGVVYSTSADPTTDDDKAMAASGGTGEFSVSLTGLAAGTAYHVRAYAINEKETSYGEDKTFTTEAANGWTVMDLPGTELRYARVFADGQRVWVLGDSRIYYSENYPAVPLTEQYHNQVDSGTAAGMTDCLLNDMSFYKNGGELFGCAVGYEGTGARTTDSGATSWQQVWPGDTTMTCVDFPTANIGYASGLDYGLQKTTNGGIDWSYVANVGAGSAGSICFLDENNGYAGTSSPSIRKTVDGGQHWESTGGVTGTISDVFFLDADHGWAVGAFDICRYHNGVWNREYHPYADPRGMGNIPLNSVFFVNENDGWACGGKGKILHTTDGGVHWLEMETGTQEDLLDVFFTSPTEGYAVGRHVILRFTGDPVTGPTLYKPRVSSGIIDNKTESSADVLGNVLDDGGSPVTERGVVYSTSYNPTTADSKVVVDGTTGGFGAHLTGLAPDTTYYTRVFATNAVGTSYTISKGFKTLAGTTVPVSGVTLNKETTTLTVGGSEQLTATVLPENASDKRVVWSVQSESDAGVLTASGGLVSALKAGTAVVRATSAGNPEAYAECQVTVNPAAEKVLTGIAISPKPISVQAGATRQVKVTASYSDQTTAEVTDQCGFEFSAGGIASIDNSGLLTGVTVGTTVLTAVLDEKRDTVDISVTSPGGGGGGGGGGSTQPRIEPVQVPEEPQVSAPAEEPSDLSGHWAHDCVMALLQHGIIAGYPDGTIRPENEITRAEAAALLVSALGLQDYQPQSMESPYQDEIPAWAKKAILTASEKKLMKGYPDGTFRPDQKITRAEMCTALMQAFPKEIPAGFVLGFTDSDSVPDWARPFVESAAGSQVVSGYPDNTFRPADNIKRAEAFSIICRLLGYHQEHSS